MVKDIIEDSPSIQEERKTIDHLNEKRHLEWSVMELDTRTSKEQTKINLQNEHLTSKEQTKINLQNKHLTSKEQTKINLQNKHLKIKVLKKLNNSIKKQSRFSIRVFHS